MRPTDVPTPPAPPVRLSIGVTGHRAGHHHFAESGTRIAAVMTQLFDLIDRAIAQAPSRAVLGSFAQTRIHTLLADGTDRMASVMGLDRGYELVAPLPFGRRLNRAINSLTDDPADARRLLAGEDARDPATQEHAAAIRALSDRARLFALADADERIATLFLAKLDSPQDSTAAALYAAEASRRVALAGRILVEQSDLVIGVWDGVTTAHVGGTGHTIATALDLGAPVLWIDPARPEDWRILSGPEALATTAGPGDPGRREAALTALVHHALNPGSDPEEPGFAALDAERWRDRSSRLAHAYRRVEALFAGHGFKHALRGLTQRYERPEAIATGSGAQFLGQARQLPGADPDHVESIGDRIMQRFAWAEGIAARLSDSYRGGMTINFVLSSLAIVGGISYLPFVGADQKWLFALAELLLLCGILAITYFGRRRRLHSRWFEARRVAEYLRHAPLLLVLGTARPPGRWPRGADASWPEFYARQVLRDVGLPRVAIGQDYLRQVLTGPLADHVHGQRDYHLAKAQRLASVHHKLDTLSGRLFQLAVAAVALYLALRGLEALHVVSAQLVEGLSKYFTVFGVMFPTFGAGIAGIRYFGDFERFGDISEVTGEKLEAIARRIALLAQAPAGKLSFGEVIELVHAADDVVVGEIENWQAVFGGKQIAVPV
ncbi:MAG: hypothetical protein KGZ65_14405 [Sphingomonadales bacterium]|nr:hypothetical protein [Sphingomonadaceae bacterium]MBS3932419.1 hypothetical protein [Sphingomonadales bacterium]